MKKECVDWRWKIELKYKDNNESHIVEKEAKR